MATLAGIQLRIHWTFSLILLFVFGVYLFSGGTFEEALFGVGLILSVFFCVVLHEFGHALTARRFGIPTRDITLYPIGGVARLHHIPEEPEQEFLIAVAGPAVNAVIAALLYAAITVTGSLPALDALVEPTGYFWARLMWFNVALVAFNLLPAFPMDGGRVLRAVLATRMEYMRATLIAARTGQGMAFLFGLFGFIVFSPILMFIALFVYLGASQEARMTMMRVVLEGVPVRSAMITHFESLDPEDTLDDAVQKLLAGMSDSFPVIQHDQMVGILERKPMMKVLLQEGGDARVRKAMQTQCAGLHVEASDMLRDVLMRMHEAGCSMVPVVQSGRLVGLLTTGHITKYVEIQSALRQANPKRESRMLVLESSESGGGG